MLEIVGHPKLYIWSQGSVKLQLSTAAGPVVLGATEACQVVKSSTNPKQLVRELTGVGLVCKLAEQCCLCGTGRLRPTDCRACMSLKLSKKLLLLLVHR